MPTIASIPLNNKSGLLTSPAVDVPAGATYVYLEFDGSTLLNPAVTLDAKIFFAPDGATFRQIGGATMVCGAKKRDGVTPLPAYPTGCDIPQEGADPQLKGTLDIGNGPITTILRIRTTP